MIQRTIVSMWCITIQIQDLKFFFFFFFLGGGGGGGGHLKSVSEMTQRANG